MIETPHNLPSNQEISFKLIQNLIPSLGYIRTNVIHEEQSLQYSQSIISIQHMLDEQVSIPEFPQKIEGSLFSKNSCLKVISVNTTTSSSLKNTPRKSFRQRIVSNRCPQERKSTEKRRKSHILEFDRQKSFGKDSTINGGSRKRCWTERKVKKRSLPKGQNIFMANPSDIKGKLGNSKRLFSDQASILFELKKSMHIKQIKLRADEQRQKNYLKHLIQARMNNIHATETINHLTPLWISRKIFNRF